MNTFSILAIRALKTRDEHIRSSNKPRLKYNIVGAGDDQQLEAYSSI